MEVELMSKPLKKSMVWIMALAVCLCASFLSTPAVYADTNGTELQVTDQPEKLVIQLGTAWAGVEFELKTDAGLYPQPVVVSAEGVLSMELGGSKTYTLSAMNSPNSAPDPDAASAPPQDETSPSPEDGQQSSTPGGDSEQPDNPEQSDNSEQTNNQEDNSQSGDEQDNNLIKGIPNMHLFMFAGGLIACIAGLVIMWVVKRRKNNRYDDSDDYDDDDEDD